MFERFTERARKVVVLAQEESERLRHDYVGTEHLLLGLIREGEGVASQALYACGVTHEEAREGVEGIAGRGEGDVSQKPFTPRSKRVLGLSLREAQSLRHNYIGTEHLLLGLIEEEESIAAGALRELGVKLDEAREQVESVVGYGEEGTGAQAPFTPRSKKVLELALREALQLGHNYIGTEHILLGLVRESEGVAARVLLNLEVDPDEIRREVIKRLPDGEDGLDPLDEVERKMEGGWHRTLFRGHVGGIQTATERGPLILDVDYTYRLPVDPTVSRASIDPQDVADVTRTRLDGARTETPEGVAEVAGTYLMETFRDLLEITVTVARRPEPSDPLAPTFSVSATFRR